MEICKLYDIDSGELDELIDSSRINLKTKNERYKNLRDKMCEIKENYPNILALFENDEVKTLNEEECKNLQKIIALYMQMSTYEDREIFFLGAQQNYYYFKNLDLIKESFKKEQICSFSYYASSSLSCS